MLITQLLVSSSLATQGTSKYENWEIDPSHISASTGRSEGCRSGIFRDEHDLARSLIFEQEELRATATQVMVVPNLIQGD